MTVATLSDFDNQLIRDQIKSNISSLIYNSSEAFRNKSSDKFFLTQFENINAIEENDNDKEIIPSRSILAHGYEQKLQKNLLAKLVIDEKDITISLIEKRREFERRINKCKEKQIKLGFKQEESLSSINRYSQFINEKEIVRKKAIIKYQTELKLRLQKMLEYEVLSKQLDIVSAKHQRISLKVQKHKKFKDFLTKAIELLPESYLEAGETKYISLMLRHQTLYESNFDLFENLIANSDKLKALRTEYERLVLEHNSNIMTVSNKLAELQKIKDDLAVKNVRFEEALWKDGDRRRKNVIDLSKIFWGIDNLAEKCYDKHIKTPLDQMDLHSKLDIIQEYILKQSKILKMAQAL